MGSIDDYAELTEGFLEMAKDSKQRPTQSPKSTGAGSGKSSSDSGKAPGKPASQSPPYPGSSDKKGK